MPGCSNSDKVPRTPQPLYTCWWPSDSGQNRCTRCRHVWDLGTRDLATEAASLRLLHARLTFSPLLSRLRMSVPCAMASPALTSPNKATLARRVTASAVFQAFLLQQLSRYRICLDYCSRDSFTESLFDSSLSFNPLICYVVCDPSTRSFFAPQHRCSSYLLPT